MGFFEQIGTKITDAGNAIKGKTQDFTETTKLNSSISEKEKQVAKLYLEIGQAYYERHKNDISCSDLSRVQQVNTLLSEITRCREEIKTIKGIEKCPRCKADVSVNAAFCPACGLQMSQSFNRKMATCPTCGNSVPEGTAFCNRCGTKIN